MELAAYGQMERSTQPGVSGPTWIPTAAPSELPAEALDPQLQTPWPQARGTTAYAASSSELPLPGAKLQSWPGACESSFDSLIISGTLWSSPGDYGSSPNTHWPSLAPTRHHLLPTNYSLGTMGHHLIPKSSLVPTGHHLLPTSYHLGTMGHHLTPKSSLVPTCHHLVPSCHQCPRNQRLLSSESFLPGMLFRIRFCPHKTENF